MEVISLFVFPIKYLQHHILIDFFLYLFFNAHILFIFDILLAWKV